MNAFMRPAVISRQLQVTELDPESEISFYSQFTVRFQ